MPLPITDPAEEGYDSSDYVEALSAAEAQWAERALQDESEADGLTPDDLRERAYRLRLVAEARGGVES
ncbi:MAG: hypothetical protein OXN79_08775 [bacterium]|nr:hypothetical protein [bacterium]